MKVLFVGPSLAGREEGTAALPEPGECGLQLRGPAQHGDIGRAVLGGAAAIGLVDGRFEDVAAVWHKEILFALSEGVQVLGGASIGALRAVECEAFGMIGVGEIFRGYACGRWIDDDAVAQLHAPAELGYRPLTEALVNVEATFGRLAAIGEMDDAEAAAIVEAARRAFFKQRTYGEIVRHAVSKPRRRSRIAELVEVHRVDLKRQDALELVRLLLELPDARRAPPADWRFQATGMWLRCLDALAAAPVPGR